MNKYIYQKFLLNCDYEDIQLSELPIYEGDENELLDYQYDYCLFDVGKTVTRKVNISDLDEKVDTEEDWVALLNSLQGIEVIVLCDHEVNYKNPIINNYREATIKAYICRFIQANKKIYLYNSKAHILTR